MLARTLTGCATALVLTVAVSGCTGTGEMVQTANGPLPDYCFGNNTASGAAIGAVGGAALGYLLGGWSGAAIGAGTGAVAGGLTGAQVDANCREAAARQAMQAALAQQAAMLQQQAAASQYGDLQASAAPIAYVDSAGGHHSVQVTHLNSYAAPAGGGSGRVCSSGLGADTNTDTRATTQISTRMCRGADGVWR